MALYAIGDVQGCFDELRALLKKLDFDRKRDRLWFTGDLVNRGPRSADVLRFVRDLGDRATTVLGNHDLHLLAIVLGDARPSKRDALDDVLEAPDRDELVAWLRQRPLFHWDQDIGHALVHAGLVPQWSLPMAQRLACEAEASLRTDNAFFRHMYGDEPDQWNEALSGHARTRFIVNALTRLRFCDANGHMALGEKGPPGSQPPPYLPWFTARQVDDEGSIVFGHWSLLGAKRLGRHIALDSGCLWGRTLSAICLDARDAEFIEVPCTAKRAPNQV